MSQCLLNCKTQNVCVKRESSLTVVLLELHRVSAERRERFNANQETQYYDSR